MRRAVFLDRDGVLNEPIIRGGKPYPPKGPDDLVLCDDAISALAHLRDLGFVLVCITNQPDVARGTVPATTIDAIHSRLMRELPLDAIFVCMHDDVDDCSCRKPKPGLIRQAADELDLDVNASYMVGDRWRDIDAGSAANCRTIFIDRHYLERSSSRPPNARVASISEAASWIASDMRSTRS